MLKDDIEAWLMRNAGNQRVLTGRCGPTALRLESVAQKTTKTRTCEGDHAWH